ncbi:MAG: outer membrane beta-barrel protein [Gammaproteobacteria bacterium]|nr:outer membrane beta-barrel protein [Gammaproteobacteria bacterium]
MLLLGGAAVESRAEEERRFHVRPFVGYAMPDKVTTEDEVGIVTADIATEDSASFGISVGTEMFLDDLLWEVEYAHRTADVDGSSFLDVPAGIPLFGGNALTLPTTVKGDVTAQSLMVNVAYLFNSGGRVSPFLQAGVGYAVVDVDSLAFSTDFGDALVPGADNDEVAYSYGVGVAVQVTPNVALDLLYRRIEYGTVYSDPSPTGLGKDEFEVEVGELSLGARFSF